MLTVCDSWNHRLRSIDLVTTEVSTLAGTGTAGETDGTDKAVGKAGNIVQRWLAERLGQLATPDTDGLQCDAPQLPSNEVRLHSSALHRAAWCCTAPCRRPRSRTRGASTSAGRSTPGRFQNDPKHVPYDQNALSVKSHITFTTPMTFRAIKLRAACSF